MPDNENQKSVYEPPALKDLGSIKTWVLPDWDILYDFWKENNIKARISEALEDSQNKSENK